MANFEATKTKADVIAAILKFEGPFRPAYVRENLALSKQNMNYHLKSLVEKGVLEQQGQLYMLIDKDKAIDLMLDIAHNERGISRSKKTVLYDGEFLRNMVDQVHRFKALNLTESDALKKHFNELLDETIKELTKEKKFLNERSVSPGSARKAIWKNYKFASDWYLGVCKALSDDYDYEFSTNEDKRNKEFNERIEEVD